MIVKHCDWCGKKVEKPPTTDVDWLNRISYVLCISHYEEYSKIIDKLQKRFDSNPIAS